MVSAILAADIGGTSSRFALFELRHGKPALVERVWLQTRQAESFVALLAMLRETGFPAAPGDAEQTVIAVAGPVERLLRSNPPNIPWDIDLERDCSSTGGSVQLINDFTAQAYATQCKPGQTANVLRAGRPNNGGTVAVLGAGTGLGQCALIHADGKDVPVPSEGGHAAFPFRRAEDSLRLFALGRLKRAYCRQEDLVSGNGLSLIHEFLTGERLEPVDVAARLPDCPDTTEIFARCYGRVARQFCLQVLATGGVFLSGGVAAKNPVLVEHPAFLEEFEECPEYAAMLRAVPVRLMTDQESGLHGAARFAWQSLTDQIKIGG